MSSASKKLHTHTRQSYRVLPVLTEYVPTVFVGQANAGAVHTFFTQWPYKQSDCVTHTDPIATPLWLLVGSKHLVLESPIIPVRMEQE